MELEELLNTRVRKLETSDLEDALPGWTIVEKKNVGKFLCSPGSGGLDLNHYTKGDDSDKLGSLIPCSILEELGAAYCDNCGLTRHPGSMPCRCGG